MRALSVVHHMAPSRSSRPGRAQSIATVTAARTLNAPARAVYDFLARLPNHALIGGHGLRLRSVAADGGSALISLRGPLGIRRTAYTAVTVRRPPNGFGGTAQVGRRTEASVRWTIDPAGTGSRVTLTATIMRAGPLDRFLLAIGGRWWVARCFMRAITLLGSALDDASRDPYARAAG